MAKHVEILRLVIHSDYVNILSLFATPKFIIMTMISDHYVECQ